MELTNAHRSKAIPQKRSKLSGKTASSYFSHNYTKSKDFKYRLCNIRTLCLSTLEFLGNYETQLNATCSTEGSSKYLEKEHVVVSKFHKN